jgi:hypothetical protein
MPRGVPNKGYRVTTQRVKSGWVPGQLPSVGQAFSLPPSQTAVPQQVTYYETDEEIDSRIAERFDILGALVDSCIDGDCLSLIVSGPAGLGKSFTIKDKLEHLNESRYEMVKGYVRPTGLYQTLYHNRHKGQIVIFDDTDSIFKDEVALNLLKAVCDSDGNDRTVSYLAQTNLGAGDDGEALPHSFKFEGTIIFITNHDFDGIIAKGGMLAPHLQALMSRSHYIDLAMHNEREYIIRIKQVVRAGMLRDRGFSPSLESDVLNFIVANQNKLRELSLRVVLKIATLAKRGGNWEHVARITTCKN